jgi:hypothetical protein
VGGLVTDFSVLDFLVSMVIILIFTGQNIYIYLKQEKSTAILLVPQIVVS